MQQPPNLHEEAFGVGLQMVLIESDGKSHVHFLQHPLWPDQTQTQICKGFVCLQLLDEHGHPRDFVPAKDWWNITGQSAHKWAAWIQTDENPCLMASLNSSATKWHYCRVDRLDMALLFITCEVWCHSHNLCRID